MRLRRALRAGVVGAGLWALPAAAQADLMDELLVLAIRDPDPNVEQAWAAEAERRLDAWERGETDAVPAEDVIDRLRSLFPR